MAPLRAALYDRVSTDEQHEGKMRTQLRAHAERIGALVVLDVEEVASGDGPLPDRDQVLDAARRREIDAVICWNLDRWGRDALDVQLTVRQLEKRGVRWIAVNDGFDFRPDDHTDEHKREFFTVAAAFASMERRRLRERTRIGMAAARARGVHCGRPRLLTPQLRSDVDTLRREGLSLRAIGAELGISAALVHLALADEPTAAQLAQLDAQRARAYDDYNETVERADEGGATRGGATAPRRRR